METDGFAWRRVQKDDFRRAEVRNVRFRDIYLQKPRTVAICILSEFNQYARSVYPGAAQPACSGITLDNVSLQAPVQTLLESSANCGILRVCNSELPKTAVWLSKPENNYEEYDPAYVQIANCTLTEANTRLLAVSDDRRAELWSAGLLATAENPVIAVSANATVHSADAELLRTPARQENHI